MLFFFFFFSSRRRHTRCSRDWSSDVCSSDLFNDRGLRWMAKDLESKRGVCPSCGSRDVPLLDRDQLFWLCERYFVRGSIIRADYGGAPAIAFNDVQAGSLSLSPALASDVALLQDRLGIGFFHYGPRLWMIGDIEPLERLRDAGSRASEIDRILSEFPTTNIEPGTEFYRVRKAPAGPTQPSEYDSAPRHLAGAGRLD